MYVFTKEDMKTKKKKIFHYGFIFERIKQVLSLKISKSASLLFNLQ